MSFTVERLPSPSARRTKVTVQTLAERKQNAKRITALTAVDYPTARAADEAGIDLVLVGDSLAMTVLGHPDTLSVTMDEMLHHTRAARRGMQSALLVADMPFGSYHTGAEEAVRNAIRFVKEAGAEAVKLEGGRERAALIEQITNAEIPVVAHIGLTPQSVHRMGGYTVQARTLPAIDALMEDAAAVEGAGAAALVLEGVPREVAARITGRAGIPTIGIGAGPECDGQILVIHDLVRLTFAPAAKFARPFGDAGAVLQDAVVRYRDAVLVGEFPVDTESYHLTGAVRETFLAESEPASKVNA